MPVSAYIVNALFNVVNSSSRLHNKVITLYTVGTKNKPKSRERTFNHTTFMKRKKKLFRGFCWCYMFTHVSIFVTWASFLSQPLFGYYSLPSFITPEWSIKKRIFIKLFITCYTTESYHVLRINWYRVQQARLWIKSVCAFFCHSKIRKCSRKNPCFRYAILC